MRFGQFEVLSRLGVGGMGEVFHARLCDGSSAEPVALKLIRPENASDRQFRTMFVNEARVSAFLHHANVVRLVDFGEVKGILYLAMEFVDGIALSRLSAPGPLPAPIASYVILELLAALDHVHTLATRDGRPLGLVHRDVSASNVLVSTTGEIKLTDFGVARVKGLSITYTGGVKGNRACMAPEQLDAVPTLDARADLFAVGVLLHKLLLGRAPFDDIGAWLRQGAPLEVEGAFASILRKTLAPNARDRFASAKKLGEALRAVMPPDASARMQLGELVRRMARVQSALPALDRLIMSEFASGVSELPSLHSPSERILTTVWNGTDASDWSQTRLPESMREVRSTWFDLEPSESTDLPTEPLQITPSRSPAHHPRRGRILAAAAVAAALAVGGMMTAHMLRSPPATRPAGLPPRISAAEPVPATVEPHLPEPKPAPGATSASRRPETPAHSPAARHARSTTSSLASTSTAPGFLTLRTEPWATAYLAGKRLGVTPFFRVPLPPGKHRLELEAGESGQRHRVVIQIVSGDETRLTLPLP